MSYNEWERQDYIGEGRNVGTVTGVRGERAECRESRECLTYALPACESKMNKRVCRLRKRVEV